jgi:hypothetical protein
MKPASGHEKSGPGKPDPPSSTATAHPTGSIPGDADAAVVFAEAYIAKIAVFVKIFLL